jgi:hypothetical protein
MATHSSAEWVSGATETWRAAPQYVAGSFSTAMPLLVHTAAGSYNTYGVASISVRSGVATVYRNQLIVNSATPANTFTLANITWQTNGATALAVGSLNWLATGD